MTYSQLVKIVALATEKTPHFTKEIIAQLTECGKELNYPIPLCTCKDKWMDLLYKLQLFVKKNKEGFPTYKWTNTQKRLLVGGKIIVPTNYTDKDVETFLSENPDKQDYFKLWTKKRKKVAEKEEQQQDENKETTKEE